MRSSVILVPLVGLLAAGSAHAQTGSGGGTLSERTHYAAFYRSRPPGSPISLLVLRGQPGWQSRTSGTSGTASASASSSASPGPVRYRFAIGLARFDCTYDPERHVLTYDGREYQLGDNNVVLIDRIDRVGGPPEIVRQLRIQLPAYSGRGDMAALIREVPGLLEFLR